MVRSTDGFEIAEADLKIRGPGDIEGTKQSGLLDFRIANLAQDGELIMKTRQVVENIIQQDPDLSSAQNTRLLTYLRNLKNDHKDWGRIS